MVRHLLESENRVKHLTIEDLRKDVQRCVQPSDIECVNRSLFEWINELRGSCHLVVDTHQVALVDYGLHCLPFSTNERRQLEIDEIWVLVAPEEQVVSRISGNRGGRRVPSLFMARCHSEFQLSIAANYATDIGCEVRVIDSSQTEQQTLGRAIAFLEE